MTKELQDLAWSVLPEEFKEKVRKEYRYALKYHKISNLQQGALDTIECLFGKHNLTSKTKKERISSLESLDPKTNSDYTPIPEKTSVSKWDKTEPKPAEPKFKEGDRVTLITGTIHTIVGVIKRNVGEHAYYLDGLLGKFFESQLIPYTESINTEMLNNALLELEKASQAVREALTNTMKEK